MSFIMSQQTKLTHMQEEERSPTKKKFREALSLSKEELDNAVLAAAKVALSEQRLELQELVKTSVGEAIEGILAPQINEIKLKLEVTTDKISSIGQQIEQHEQSIKRLESRCDNVQAATRSDKATIRNLQATIGELSTKLADMEDRSRRSNLPEGAEGGDAVFFLESNIRKWLLSLSGHPINIERAHRIYSRNSRVTKGPCTIFKRLRFSLETANQRKAFADIKKKLKDHRVQSFLHFPAILKVTHGRQELEFKTPEEAEQFFQSIRLQLVPIALTGAQQQDSPPVKDRPPIEEEHSPDMDTQPTFQDSAASTSSS